MRSIELDIGGGARSASPRAADIAGIDTDASRRGARLAGAFFPELIAWLPVLERLAVPLEVAADVAARARVEGSDFATGLVEAGAARTDAVLEAVAADLGVGVAGAVEPERLLVGSRHAIALLRRRAGHIPVKLLERDGSVSFLIALDRLRLDLLRRRLRSCPGLAARMKLVDPQVLRAAMLRRAHPLLARRAVHGLFERFPAMSARFVANAWQGTVVGIVLAALPAGIVLAPGTLLMTLHVLATLFFFACVALRFAAVAAVRRPGLPPAQVPMPRGEVPVFTVLVALYREAAVVPGLLAALDRIVWPRRRLEIKLVCEADDAATLAALRARRLATHVEVVEVPPRGPRTKPKALAYALPMTGGDFVALYDAEDEPHPMQLAEAWQRFCRSGPELAVVQAPLEISNRDAGAIARMFAFEYAGLFRGLLPWLSQRRLMLPLGGTSNIFRRAALEEVGGWDPYNVTEDADLGARLARFGYRAETISCPTFEPAPTRLDIWLRQRTRWFKGWSQTWLVHMREPVRLARDLGTGSFLAAQVLFAGMLVSVLLHPILLATFLILLGQLLSGGFNGTAGSMLLAIDIVNIACGYLSFLLLGWQTLTPAERPGFWKVVLLTPFYWAMMSVAGWRAVWQLWRCPHLWEKTPHEPAAAGLPRYRARKAGPSPMILGSSLPIASGSRPA